MHHRLRIKVPVERQDALVAELWTAGTVGLELSVGADPERIDAYFSDRSSAASVEAAPWLTVLGADLVASEPVVEEDWLAAYREHSQPKEVGGFWVDPREPSEAQPEAGLRVLRIPARNAFGTGSHESTRLVLELLARLDLADRRVLDVGTGSGILAFACLASGASGVVGFDLDFGSIVTARDNAELNRLHPKLFAGTVSVLAPRAFDVVLVNILPERWLHEAELVVAQLARPGYLIVSGLLDTQVEEVTARLDAFGCRAVATCSEGDWAAVSLTRPRLESG